jgi:hypothetical protein
VGRRFQEENDDVRDHDERDLGMKGTRRGRESGKKYLKGVLGVNREKPDYIVRKSARGIG